MANGNGNGNGNGGPNGFWWGMPWWVKAIAIVGVPSLLSLGIVWSDRVQLVTRIDAQSQLLSQMQEQMIIHAQRDSASDDVIREATQETNRILLATCVNNAKDELARERCVGGR